ncbi:MAG: energy transducer TonB [Bacteroidales bacterium]|nr:energy transducer TonB [Bacteroidales bacterium]
MEVKKTDKANLEKKRGMFLQLGYVIVLGLVLLAFEWGTRPGKIDSLGELADMDIEEEIIPITRPKNEPPPPPPPVQTTDVINIVDDDVEIEDELILDDTETDQDEAIEINELEEEEEEIVEQEVFFVVEDMPLFQGKNKDAFRIYIQKNLKYPVIAQENGVSGKVFVQFDISPKGSVTNIVVVRGVDPSLDKEAVRVVKSSPKWTPGKQRGRPVNVRFTFPIVFQLQ